MDGETREFSMVKKWWNHVGCMRGRTVSMEVKKVFQDSIISLTLANASKTWMWNESHTSVGFKK